MRAAGAGSLLRTCCLGSRTRPFGLETSASKCTRVDERQQEGLVKVPSEELSFDLVTSSCREPSSLQGGSWAWEASNLCRISLHAGMQHVDEVGRVALSEPVGLRGDP